MVIPGLPEGLEVVGYRDARDEFCLEDGRVGKYHTVNRSMFIVNAVSGFSIEYHAPTNSYEVTKSFDGPKSMSALFEFTSERQWSHAIKVLSKIEGFRVNIPGEWPMSRQRFVKDAE